MSDDFPDEPVGDFPEPPRTITDGAGREIRIVAADASHAADLVDMYADFDPADRAQGIPPVEPPAIENWLETVLGEDCGNVIAWHGEDAVGHATLVPDEGGAYELAIFVLADYQGAGIGTALLETLLGHGQAHGLERVWLTVERWNEPAKALYRSVGFEVRDGKRFELEMGIRI
jgi:GNAT superfamily N-acetyltransferase